MESRGLLKEWHDNARAAEQAHFKYASNLTRLNNRLGTPSAIFSAIVATSIYATMQESGPTFVKIMAVILALASSALSGLQTFKRFGERAEQHRQAGASYSSIRMKLEQALAMEQPITEMFVTEMREQLDQLNDKAPLVDESIWTKVASVNLRSLSIPFKRVQAPS